MIIRFTLNHQPVELDLDPLKPLLDVLREDLQLTGTKQGCDHEGECGACTVLINGKPIRSCLTPAAKVHDQQVLTVEGLGSRDNPHPLQTAFVQNGAVQCGYCIPGVLMSGKALLDANPDPSREDIKQALAGNLCRCTGYQRMIDSVQQAASVLQDQPRPVRPTPQPAAVLGGNPTRTDSWDQVTGRIRFVQDRLPDDALVIAAARSPFHHARLISIAAEKTLTIKGIRAVITADDIPGKNGLGDYSRDEPVLVPVGDTCKMRGAPIALIAADSAAAAQHGLRALEVDYQQLEPQFTLEEVEAQHSPQIYPGGNLLESSSAQWGNLDQALTSADLILTSEYRTAWQEHAALERESLLGYFDHQGRLTVMGGTHEPHWQQNYIAACLNLDPAAVRVVMPPTGGSFGGKQDPWPFLATALVVYLTEKPAYLIYSREESFSASPKRHPYRVRYQIGALQTGQLTGIRARVDINTGGYDGHGQYITDYALVGSGGPYQYQAVDGIARSLYSNGPKGGQFRGFGTPQSTFALECTLDEIAQQLEIDPLQFRKQNSIEQNSISYLGYPIQESLGYQQVLDAIQPDYQTYCREAEIFNHSQPPESPFRKAVGLAGMWYRFGKSGSLTIRAEAVLEEQGKLVIKCSAPDYGQGSTTVMSQLAAETLGLPREALEIINADTALTPDSGIQGASRATYFVGGAVVRAAENLKQGLLQVAAELLDRHPDDLKLTGEGVKTHPQVDSKLNQQRQITFRELAEEMDRLGLPRTFPGVFDLNDQFPEPDRPSYIPLFVTGAQAAEVMVNIHTGQVGVPRITAAHDVGKAVNPLDAKGQIEGSVLMGLGTALMEEYHPTLTRSLGDYYLPTALSVPEISSILVEIPSFEGPYGVKGLGEAAILPTVPAIINGVSRAVGYRIRDLPATPERVLAAVHSSRRQG